MGHPSNRAPWGTYRSGTWTGWVPIQVGHVSPPKGAPVVYHLFGDHPDNPWHVQGPYYIGSTDDFRGRIRSHIRDGKVFRAWSAFLCVSRAAAYVEEKRRIAGWMPPANVSGNPAVVHGQIPALMRSTFYHFGPTAAGCPCHTCGRLSIEGGSAASNGERIFCLTCAERFGWVPTGPPSRPVRDSPGVVQDNPDLVRALEKSFAWAIGQDGT